MKKFFSRFSAAGPVTPAKPSQEPSFDRSEKHDLYSPAVKAAPAIASPFNSIGRTRALVAKFEGVTALPSSAGTSTAPQLAIPAPAPDLPIAGQAHPPFQPSSSSGPGTASVPKRIPGSSLPASADLPSGTRIFQSDTAFDPSGSTSLTKRTDFTEASSNGHNAHAIKTVAFAPSPQKQRSTSPAHIGTSHRTAASQPLSRTNSKDNNAFATPGNFARPTAASQARARTWTRSASSDTSHPPAPNVSTNLRDRGTSVQTRSSKSRISSSMRSTSRRSYSYSSTPVSRDGGASLASMALTNNGIQSQSQNADTSSRSMARGGSFDLAPGISASPIASIDLHSPATGPFQFPTRTSLSMRKSYSGSNSSRPTSRRNSVDPHSPTAPGEPVIFPPSASPALRSFGFPTWSEMTNEELVRNLGPRERTRQEVLWEIVASEERYVMELEKVKDLYIDALINPEHFDLERVLPPVHPPSVSSPVDVNESQFRSNAALWEDPSAARPTPAITSSAELPIAARFMSNVSAGNAGGGLTDTSSKSILAQWDTHKAAGARSPYSMGVSNINAAGQLAAHGGQTQKRSEAAYGLGLGLGTTATRDRSAPAYMNISTATKSKDKISRAQKLRGLSSKAGGDANPLRLTVPLPPSLREVLVAMSEGLTEAHGLLSDALKARYEEQWPLVRSLADVFMKHSHILEHYASYVCHLQRAMEELEEAALMERAFRGKRLKKERLSNTVGLGRTVAALEACAAEQGYAGLSIFASMPFQRLLKYPLLFQNLLFHTDPSTHEFESTVGMVVEVERLVRSIEDEKVTAEERDKARDVFARIDGITDRVVLRPRPDRVLIEECALYDESARRTLSESAPKDGRSDANASDSEGAESGSEGSGLRSGRRGNSSQSGLRAALRNKRSYRRLSDFLSAEQGGGGSSKAPTMGSKKDLWLVRFSDVEIKCQRIGVTALPMVSTAALRTADDDTTTSELTDFAASSKDSRERLKALRSTTLRAKTRNLYRFISVVAWRNAATRQMFASKEGGLDGLPTSHEVDEEFDEAGEDDDGASISCDDGSSATSSASSDSSEGVGGQAGSDKYVRSTKLSFTYWGDRIEPGRALAAPHTGSKKGTASAHGRGLGSDRPGGRSDVQVAASLHRASHSTSAASADSSVGASSRSTHEVGAARIDGRTDGTRVTRQARWSSVNGGSMANTSAARPGGSRTGVSGRLSEPLAATSMSTAPEPMQTAVAQMHARQRNDKFGARLRSSLPYGGTGSSVAVGASTESASSHISVNSAAEARNRPPSATGGL
ncbi:uncharacterized protein PSANT_02388 [Moesziomyces antarcticus]|uniref:DH domain-containing protein n=1 Tax=Pseudozyma antarctica TaxID=84753 RepID=A0A5C3FK08_PSEA2|nr:uncharacterized protein PSANT_02388 [Moesziomyces antarcticus]